MTTTTRRPLKRLHVTDRDLFKECRRKFEFNVIRRVVPKDEWSTPMIMGSAGHRCLAAYHADGEDPVSVFERILPERIPNSTDPRRLRNVMEVEEQEIMRKVLAHYLTEDGQNPFKGEVIGVEKELTARIPGTRATLVGTLDLIYLDGRVVYGVDHKFLDSLPDPKRLDMDDQMSGYIWLLTRNFPQYKCGGMVYNVLRRKAPRVPQVLKSTKALSQDKSIDTTLEVYLQAIYDNNFDPRDYAEILEHLKQKGNKFFIRKRLTRGRQELLQWEKDLTAEVREITSSKTTMYPHPTWDCARCEYLPICKSMNEGGDWEYLMRRTFKEKVGRE